MAAEGHSLTITADRPVTFHLSGSGSLNVTKGTSTTYTAPATVAAPHTIGGCMAAPSDSVFNTRVDNLPVNAESNSWTSLALADSVSFYFGWGINVVDQTAPLAVQQFELTPQFNGTLFPAFSPLTQKRENGTLTTNSNLDHHVLVLNQSTCQFYETNQTGLAIANCPQCTAQSGLTYNSGNYAQPAQASTDPAGLPLGPLTLHLSELLGGSVNHALRFTACAECIGNQALWPAITSNGLQNGAPPMGTRFRLKASVNISSFPSAAYAVLTAMKRYGMILAGTGPTAQISVATDVTADATIYEQLQTIAAAHLSASDFEAVDESSLQLTAGSYAVNPANKYEMPSNYATLTLTDQANPKNVLTVPIALAPVTIGTSESMLVVQGGTASFQLSHWVTGTSNTAATWTISPASGAGTLTGDGFYTAPSVVTTPQTALIQATSSADKSATLRFYITLIPNGGIRIDSGSTTGSQDTRGLTWFPDLGLETGSFTSVTDTPSAWGSAFNAAALSSYLYTAGSDLTYRLHVPNGTYQVGLSFGVGDCEGTYPAQVANQSATWGALNLQSQNTLAYANWNFSAAIGSTCRAPQTVTLPAQVTNGILSFAVRASSLNGEPSAALLNAVSILPIYPAPTTSGSSSAAQTSSASTLLSAALKPAALAAAIAPTPLIYTPQEFDPSCGVIPGYNCVNAFSLAFKTLAQAGGGILQLPAGTFPITFTGVVQNIPAGSGLNRNDFLVVPANTLIQGTVAADGTPNSTIQWSTTSIPAFVFDGSSHSSMTNLHLQFTGTTATAYPFGDEAMLTALGYTPTYPHANELTGGNFELSSFAFVYNSDYTTFDHLIFDSATHDNNHIYGFAINLKGKGVIVANGGGGLSQAAESNRITNIQVYDYNNALLVCGQDNLLLQNIVGDRRGSISTIAPGHLLYTSATEQWDVSGNLTGYLSSTNVTIKNLLEGPDTYSNAVAGGTLAPKFLNGAVINNVISQHPEGLLDSIYVDQNVTFSNLTWTSNYALCSNVPTNCSTPAINSAASPSNLPATSNLTFQNVSLTSTASPTWAALTGNNLVVNGLKIATPPTFFPTQTATNSILSLKLSSQATITGYSYTPLITSYNAATKYNTPFTGWNPTTNANTSVTLNWPKAVTLPTSGSILTSGYQSTGAAYNNVVTTTVVRY